MGNGERTGKVLAFCCESGGYGRWAMMRKKQTEEPDTILDPTYWHLLPEKQRREAQKELEDTLEAALDEGEPVEADDQFWDGVHARFLANVEALEAAKKKM